MKIWPVYVTLQNNLYQKKYMKNVAWTLVSGLFNFQRIYCKKESVEARMLIWTNFDSFAITCLIKVDCF